MENQKDKKELSPLYSLDNMDRLILKLVIQFPGIKQGAIAKEVGLTRGAVNQRLQKPAFIAAYQDATATTDELLLKGQEAAVRRMIDIIKRGTPREATEAAKVIHVMSMGTVPGQKEQKIKQLEGIVFETQIGDDGLINRSVQEVYRELPPAPPAKPEPRMPEVTIDAEVTDVSED